MIQRNPTSPRRSRISRSSGSRARHAVHRLRPNRSLRLLFRCSWGGDAAARRIPAAAVVVAVALAAATTARATEAWADPPTFGSADEITDLGKLAVGQERFWHGPFVAAGGLASGGTGLWPTNVAPSGSDLGSAHCRPTGDPESSATVPCFRYVLRVGEGGERLRIAVDHPHVTEIFGGELRAPDGTVVAQDSGEPIRELAAATGALYSFELFVSRPVPGDWTFTVIAHDVWQSQFRFRAKLEQTIDEPTGHVALLPDLRPTPPLQLAFLPCDEERAEVRCLRLSQGPQNVGAGPLDLVIATSPDNAPMPGTDANGDETLIADQHQQIHYADGTTETEAAGKAEFHVRHHHWHHSQTGNLVLFRVTDVQTGAMEKTGDGPKQGFCMGDYAIAEWSSFNQQARRKDLEYFDGRGSCAVPTLAGQQMGLMAGWSDIYPWFVPGQYVEFGADDGDGFYVVQAQTNPPRDASETQGPIRESDHDNNFAYTYIEVCGNDLDVLERGYGTGPMDADKVVVEDGRPAALDSPKTYPSRRSERCD